MFAPKLDAIVTTASNSYGLGAALSQINNSREITVENMSSAVKLCELQIESNEVKCSVNWNVKFVKKLNSISDQMQPYNNVKDELYVCDNIVTLGDRSVVADQLHNDLLHAAHESYHGHALD